MNWESVNYSYEDPQATRELFAKGNPPPNGGLGEGGNPPPNGKPEEPPPQPDKPGNPVPNGG